MCIKKSKNEIEAHVWDTHYKKDVVPWRSKGLSPLVAQYMQRYARGSGVLEVGCGSGEDATSFLRSDWRYCGLDISREAVRLARKKHTQGIFLAADFFAWRSLQKFSVIYDKGVFHNLAGPKRRDAFVRKAASLLHKDGIWVTVCGSADGFDPNNPHGAIFLQHLIAPAERYFEVLEIKKALYGVADKRSRFDAWYCVFRRR
jgi:cyclopropane fatty-acyl-phospholipid synthase-like methyltransferase